MAIVKIISGLAGGPSVFVQPVLNQLAALLNAYGYAQQFYNGNVKKGALFSIGGTMYVADSDTAINGTETKYIRLTAGGDIATADYVLDLTGVSWNGSYAGYYDTSGNLYIFDELAAYEAGAITEYMREFAPIKYMRNGTVNGIDAKTIQGLNFKIGSSGTYGSQTISANSGWIIPAGLYMISVLSSAELRIKSSGGSFVGNSEPSGLIISNGSDYEIFNTSTTTTATIYYRKLL